MKTKGIFCMFFSLLIGLPVLCLSGAEKVAVAALLNKEPVSFDDAAWGKAEIYNLDRLNQSQREIKNKTLVKIGYNREKLFFGVKCFETERTDKLVTKTVSHDGPVWNDDSVEIFLSPSLETGRGEEYLQFLINATGTTCDAKGFQVISNIDLTFEGRWKTSTTVKNDCWEILVSIEFKSFSAWPVPIPPKKGNAWYIKMFRNYQAKGTNPQEKSGLFPTKSSFHDIDAFGKLAFSSFEETVAPIKEVATFEEKIKALTDMFEEFPQNAKKTASPYLSEVSKKIVGFKKIVSESRPVNKTEYENFVSLLDRTELLFNHLALAVETQAKLDLKDMPLFGCTVCHGYRRFFKDIPYKGALDHGIAIDMAKGERRSFQVVVFPAANMKKISVTVDLKELTPYLKTGRVDYTNISQFRYSKAIKTAYFPDPIVDYEKKSTIVLDSPADFETIPFWITIDLPENFRSGSYEGRIMIASDKGTNVTLPLKVNILNFSIATRPNIIIPYSDPCTVLGVYTGYLRERNKGSRSAFEIIDRDKYFETVRMLCQNLVEHRITTSRMSAFGIAPWFVLSQENGEWKCDASFFRETVKIMLDEGIRTVMLDECPQGRYPPLLDAVMKSLGEVIKQEGWQDIIWYKGLDEPDMARMPLWLDIAKTARKYNIKIRATINSPETMEYMVPYLDAYCPSGPTATNRAFWELLRKFKVPVWPYDNSKSMTYQSPLHTFWSSMWDMYHWKTDMYIYYAHNLWVYWNKGDPWNYMPGYDGLAQDYVVYPPKNFPGYYSDYKGAEKAEFYIVSSMRQQAITEAIEGYLYIKKLEETIYLLEDKKDFTGAAEGRKILEKWDSSFLKRGHYYIEPEEFLTAHREIGQFINRYSTR